DVRTEQSREPSPISLLQQPDGLGAGIGRVFRETGDPGYGRKEGALVAYAPGHRLWEMEDYVLILASVLVEINEFALEQVDEIGIGEPTHRVGFRWWGIRGESEYSEGSRR